MTPANSTYVCNVDKAASRTLRYFPGQEEIMEMQDLCYVGFPRGNGE